MVLSEILGWNVRRHPEKTAIVFGKQRYSYRLLLERVNRLANALLSLGVKHGDRIGIMSENNPQHIEALFAVGKLGGILVEIGVRSSNKEVLHVINKTTPKVMIVSRKCAEQISSMLDEGVMG